MSGASNIETHASVKPDKWGAENSASLYNTVAAGLTGAALLGFPAYTFFPSMYATSALVGFVTGIAGKYALVRLMRRRTLATGAAMHSEQHVQKQSEFERRFEAAKKNGDLQRFSSNEAKAQN